MIKQNETTLLEKIAKYYLLSVFVLMLIVTSIPSVPIYAATERIFTLDFASIPDIDKFIVYPDRLEARGAATTRDPSRENYEEGPILYTKSTTEFDILELTGTRGTNVFVVGSGGDSDFRRPSKESNCTIRLNNFDTGSNLYLGEFRKASNNMNYNITIELIGTNRVSNVYMGASGGNVTINGTGSLSTSNFSLNNYRRYGLNNGFLHWEYWKGENNTATLTLENGTLNVNGNLLCTQTGTAPDVMGGTPPYVSGATKPATLIQNSGLITVTGEVLCGSNEYGNLLTTDGGTYIQNGGLLKCIALANGGEGNRSNQAGVSGLANNNSKGGNVTIKGNGVMIAGNGTVANGGVGYRFPGGNSNSVEIPAEKGSVTTNKGYFSGKSESPIEDNYGRPVSKVTLKMEQAVADSQATVTIDDDTITSYTDNLGQYICYLPVTRENSKASITVNGVTYRGVFKPTTNATTNVFTLTKGNTDVDNSFKPSVLNQSASGEYYVGQTVSLFVTAKSALTGNELNLNYEWEKQNADTSFTAIPSTNNAIFKQDNITDSSAGVYRCKVIDKDSSFTYTSNIAITVAKREQKITTAQETYIKKFGEADYELKNDINVLDNANVTYSLVTGDDVIDQAAFTADGTISIKKTGVAKVRLATEETSKYKAASKDITIAVNKASVPITMSSDLNVTYGDDYNINVSVENGVTYKVEYKPVSGGAYTGDKPVNAGNYLVKVTTTDTNYDTATLISSLVISKRNLFFTDIQITEKIYDGNTEAVVKSYKVANSAIKDDGAISLTFNAKFESKDTGKNIKVALRPTINGSEEMLKNYNYVLPDFGTGNIAPAGLLIKINNYTREKGLQNPKFEYRIAGFITGENKANTNFVEPTVSTVAEKNTEEGTYPIMANGAAADNYNISYEQGEITIIKADEQGIIATIPNKSYDGKKIDIRVGAAPTERAELTY